jgi:hypothetical protein
MDERARAEEHLRIIRALMERATIYRAISAPTALAGGLLALGLAVAIYYADSSARAAYASSRNFAWLWLALLAVVLAINGFFLWREASRERRPFFSSGMRLTIRAVVPCLIVPAMVTIWFLRQGFLGSNELLLVTTWIVFYGLALLSTAFFAPQSLVVLGWAFLLTGLSAPILQINSDDLPRQFMPTFFMGLTFGLYHLIYALCIWFAAKPARIPTSAA